MGQLVYLPAGVAGPDPDAFLSDVLTELQQFFDMADLEPERILNAGRKGALAAWRDAVAFKTLYGWGLRRSEVRHLQLVDFSRNARAPFFGEWGLVGCDTHKLSASSPKLQYAAAQRDNEYAGVNLT